MSGMLLEEAAKYNINLTSEMLVKFEKYYSTLEIWNEKINLTAIRGQENVEVKHFLDSLLLLDAVQIPRGASLLDIGTGAGFPAVPIKIYRDDIELTLLDSLQKRILFLKELSELLEQSNRLIHGRAEDYARLPDYRERYSYVTARAVAALPALCEYCLPFVGVGGSFIALKGQKAEEEAEAAKAAIHTLGAELCGIKQYFLPDGSERNIILIKKISQTPLKYPRKSVKITKAPL